MNATLFVPTHTPGGEVAEALGPLVDRPFLQHVIERLVAQSFDSIDLVTAGPSQRVSALVGDGARWGTTIAVHETSTAAEACSLLRRLYSDHPFLLGRADRLIRYEPFTDIGGGIPSGPMSYLVAHLDPTRCPTSTGWVWVWPRMLEDLSAGTMVNPVNLHTPPYGHWMPGRGGRVWGYGHAFGGRGWPGQPNDAMEVVQALANHPSTMIRRVREVLSASTLKDLHWANQRVLENATGLLMTGRSDRPGIRLGRGARIHPDVSLNPPVFIGSDVEISRGCAIGTGTVVGSGSIIDKGSVVERSVIGSETYIGESLDIRDAVVNGNSLHHVRYDASVRLTDPFLLSQLGSGPHPDEQRPLLA